jgi:hypothetical protein
MWMEQTLRADHTFSIRWKGALQLGLWSCLAAWYTRRLAGLRRQDLALGHAAICLTVIMDPGNTLYLNAFYSEASVLLFLYALLGGVLVALAGRERIGPSLVVGIGLAALLLALTKIQHLLVPLLVFAAVALSGVSGRRPPRALLLALATGAALGAAIQGAHMRIASNQAIRSANLVDTLFTALLPNTSDPQALLARLNLPDACSRQSGMTWYTPGMQERQLCPEVFELRQSDLLMAAIADPSMAVRAILGGMERMRPWIPSHLGVVEGHVQAGLPASVPSASRLFDQLGSWAMSAIVCGLPLLGFLVVYQRRSEAQMGANAVLLVVCVLPVWVVATAVFGDGFMDLAKHSQLAFAAILAAIGVFAFLAIARVFRACARWR